MQDSTEAEGPESVAGVTTSISRLSFIVTDQSEEVSGQQMVRAMGFNWTVWVSGTSFYLKVRRPDLSEVKISLHGPDPRPGLTPVYRLGPDSSFRPKEAQTYGSLIVAADGDWPVEFTGQRITSTVQRVIRFNYSAEMFTPGVPDGGPAELSKSVTKANGQHAHFTCPTEGGLFVDAYLSAPGTDAYFENEEATRAANAGIGPLVNEAGQSLTLVSSSVSNPHKRDPNWQLVSDEQVAELQHQDLTRTIAMNVDAAGLLWITEKIAPADFGPDADELFVGQFRPTRP